MEASISQKTYIDLKVSVDELRTLVHRLAPDDSFLKAQAEALLPKDHEQLAEDMSDVLRVLHDRKLPHDAV